MPFDKTICKICANEIMLEKNIYMCNSESFCSHFCRTVYIKKFSHTFPYRIHSENKHH